MNEDEIAGALNALAARQDALAAAWIALAITVCRANPRALAGIESLALEWSLRRAESLEGDGLTKASWHMQSQLEVLLSTVQTQMKADRSAKR